MTVTIALRQHSADGSLIGELPAGLMPEVVAVLDEYRNVLEELIRIDLAHSWGYDAAFNDRFERVTKLRDAIVGEKRD